MVVCPPYDIISHRQQHLYHQKHPDNAIRLDFGLTSPGDDERENRYTRAADLLKEWMAEKVILPEAVPAVYQLREEYRAPGGGAAVREGLIAAIRLSPFEEGKILPHEETSPGPKQDRLRLIEATEANLSPIFCLYSDPDDVIAHLINEADAVAEEKLTDEAGARHFLRVLKGDDVEAALSALAAKTLLIADGHHRYETMLAYRDARRAAEHAVGGQPYDFTMAYLTNMDNDSRWILPVHRFVSSLPPEAVSSFLESLTQEFEIRDLSGGKAGQRQKMMQAMAEMSRERNTFGLYIADSDSYHILVARQPRPILPDAGGRSVAYRSLDVAVLDELVLASVLGSGHNSTGSGARVDFIERTGAAFRKIDRHRREFQVGLFVNNVNMAEIKAVAEASEKMPSKSTYFYPKPLTGLVFRSLNI